MNMIGNRFGRLLCIEESQRRIFPGGSSQRQYLCLCDCGVQKIILGPSLRVGDTKSCGCLAIELRLGRIKHGAKRRGNRSAEYTTWAQMRARCLSPRTVGYKNYGGRGIGICERWDSFDSFLADMGPRPAGMSIERTDVNGQYCPSNCRWATRREQSLNTRRSRKIVVGDVEKTLVEWAESTGLDPRRISARIKRGWSAEDAMRPI